jgi:hypothetical protein
MPTLLRRDIPEQTQALILAFDGSAAAAQKVAE